MTSLEFILSKISKNPMSVPQSGADREQSKNEINESAKFLIYGKFIDLL